MKKSKTNHISPSVSSLHPLKRHLGVLGLTVSIWMCGLATSSALTPQEIYSSWYRTDYPISHYNTETVYTPYFVVVGVDEYGVEYGYWDYYVSYVNVPVYYNDSDGDGLADTEESAIGSNASASDSDGDGLKDGFEVHYTGTSPGNSHTAGGYWNDGEIFFGYSDPDADYDGDGLTNGLELTLYFTDPKATDTDGDGVSDFDEVVIYGTDPTRPPSP